MSDPTMADRLWEIRGFLSSITGSCVRELCNNDVAWRESHLFLICPNCYYMHVFAGIPMPAFSCSKCHHEVETDEIIVLSALARDAAYYGYSYGRIDKRSGVRYKLYPSEAGLILLAFFVVQVVREVSKHAIGDVYEVVKNRIKKVIKEKRRTLEKRKLRGQSIEKDQLNEVFESEESLDLFVKYTVDHVRERMSEECIVRFTQRKATRHKK